MKNEIENIIKKYLPEKKEEQESVSVGPIDIPDIETQGFNQALSQIDTSLIADEVLRVVRGKINTMPRKKSAQDMPYGSVDAYVGYNTAIDDILSSLSPNKEIE